MTFIHWEKDAFLKKPTILFTFKFSTNPKCLTHGHAWNIWSMNGRTNECYKEIQVLFSGHERSGKGEQGGWNPAHALLTSQVLRGIWRKGVFLQFTQDHCMGEPSWPSFQGLCILRRNFLYRNFLPSKGCTYVIITDQQEKNVVLVLLSWNFPVLSHQAILLLSVLWMPVTQHHHETESSVPPWASWEGTYGLRCFCSLKFSLSRGQHPSCWRR